MVGAKNMPLTTVVAPAVTLSWNVCVVDRFPEGSMAYIVKLLVPKETPERSISKFASGLPGSWR